MLFPTVVAALLLSVNCLYDGDEVQWNRHGYVVKLVIREHLTDNSSTCTGSLISPSAVLTSSKCFPRTDEVNYEAVVIVPTPGSRKTMNKAMLDVYVKDEIAILRIDTVKVPLCPRPPAPSRIARLNIKSTFLSHPYKKVSVDDLKDLNCRVLGFKTENDGDDFTIKHQAMSIDVGLREETDSLMFAENENLGMACWGDIGAPLECALNEEGTFVQVGVLRSVYAVSPSEDWDSSNATCTDVKTMQFAVFVDDTVAQGVENVDKVGLFTAYHKGENAPSTTAGMNPKRRLLLLSMLLAFTSIFQMGYTNAYPNTAIVEFRDYLNDSSVPLRSLTTSEYEWRWSAMLNSYFIGFAIGSCATGYIADRIGRRLTLLLGNVANLASVVVAFLSIWFYTPVLFGISRLIMSLGAAVSMNSLILLLQESAMSDMKGVVSFNAEMAFVVTNMLGALFGMQSVLGKNLLLLIGVSLVPTTLSVVMTFWVKESPRYLLLKKKDSDAASKSIYFYQRSNEEEIQKALEDVQREAQLENKDSSFFELFTTPHLRKGFLLGLTTMQLTTSIWPVVYYSTDFLTRAGSSPQLAELVSTVMLFVSSLSTMAGMVVVERCSRKWLLIACASVNIAALVGFTGCAAFQYKFDYLTYGCIASLIVHGMSYSIGLGPIAWFITSELVPLANRASAQSLVLAINHVFALIITFLTLPLYSSMGPTILLLMFIIPGFFCLMILVIYLPETRNVHINDVVLELQGLRKRNKAQTYAS